MKLLHQRVRKFPFAGLKSFVPVLFYIKTIVVSVRGYGCLCSNLSHSKRPKFIANGNRSEYICHRIVNTNKSGNLNFLKLCEYSDCFDPYRRVYRIVGRCVNRLAAKQVLLCDGLQSSETILLAC
jgi:hypothetical protein